MNLNLSLFILLQCLFVGVMSTITTFGNECSEFCKTQHSGKGTTIYESSLSAPVKYSVDDINYISCKHRCRIADVIRPKQQEEKLYI